MYVTVITGLKAGAIWRPGHETLYILFVQSYRKHPVAQVPRWSIVSLGDFAHVMRAVAGMAAECESGRTMYRRTRMSAEKMLVEWRKAIRRPVLMDDVAVELWIGDDFSAPIPSDHAFAALNALSRAGFDRLAKDLASKSVSIRLYAFADALATVFGSLVPPERLVGLERGCRHVDTSAAPPRRRSTAPVRVPAVSVYTLGERAVVIGVDGGPLHASLRDSCTAAFIRTTVCELEIQAEGAGIQALAAWREALASAVPLPLGTVVYVDVERAAPLQGKLIGAALVSLMGIRLPVDNGGNCADAIWGVFCLRLRRSDEVQGAWAAALPAGVLRFECSPAGRMSGARPAECVP